MVRDIPPDGWPADRQGCCTVLTREEGSVDGDERANYVSQKQQVPYEAAQFKGARLISLFHASDSKEGRLKHS